MDHIDIERGDLVSITDYRCQPRRVLVLADDEAEVDEAAIGDGVRNFQGIDTTMSGGLGCVNHHQLQNLTLPQRSDENLTGCEHGKSPAVESFADESSGLPARQGFFELPG